MTLDELRSEIQQALRADLPRARRLVATFARRAADSGDPMAQAEARFQEAQLAHVGGRLQDAADGYAAARAAFARRRAGRHLVAADIGAVQVHALLGDATAVRRTAQRVRRSAKDPLHAAVAELAIGNALESLGDESGAEAALLAAEHPRGAARRRSTVRLWRPYQLKWL